MWVAAAALPVLVAVYFLHHRFRRREISSLLLWTEGRRLSEGGHRVARMHFPWLLLLELLILLLLILAGVDIRWQAGESRRRLVVVLDDSASMRATGLDGVQWREKAMGFLKDALAETEGAPVRGIIAGETTELLPASDAAALLSAVDKRWRCLQAKSEIGRALAFAGRSMPDARVLVLTDQLPPDQLDGGRIVWRSVGGGAANVAIVSASRSDGATGDRILVQLANFGEATQQVNLLLSEQGERVQAVNRAIGAGDLETIRYTLPAGVGDLTVGLDIRDGLAIDNVAWLLPDESAPLRVALNVSSARLRGLVKRALLATGKVRLQKTRPELVVTDSASADVTGAWKLQIEQPESPMSFVGPFVVDASSRLLDGIELGATAWAGTTNAWAGGGVLVAAGTVPLLWEAAVAPARRFGMQFHPGASTLQQTAAWPVLFLNLVNARLSYRPGFAERHFRPDLAMAIRTGDGAKAVEVVWPDGELRRFEVEGDRMVIPADRPGIYTSSQTGGASRCSLNFTDAGESDLTDCVSGQWGEWDRMDTQVPLQRSASVWLLLGALALFVLHHRILLRMGTGGGV